MNDSTKMTPVWSKENGVAAAKEGWSISESEGSENGPWQIQVIDDPEEWAQSQGYPVPKLTHHQQAWMIVRTGTGEHHSAARAFIAAHNPQEWEAMNRMDTTTVTIEQNVLRAVAYVVGVGHIEGVEAEIDVSVGVGYIDTELGEPTTFDAELHLRNVGDQWTHQWVLDTITSTHGSKGCLLAVPTEHVMIGHCALVRLAAQIKHSLNHPA